MRIPQILAAALCLSLCATAAARSIPAESFRALRDQVQLPKSPSRNALLPTLSSTGNGDKGGRCWQRGRIRWSPACRCIFLAYGRDAVERYAGMVEDLWPLAPGSSEERPCFPWLQIKKEHLISVRKLVEKGGKCTLSFPGGRDERGKVGEALAAHLSFVTVKKVVPLTISTSQLCPSRIGRPFSIP